MGAFLRRFETAQTIPKPKLGTQIRSASYVPATSSSDSKLVLPSALVVPEIFENYSITDSQPDRMATAIFILIDLLHD